VVEMTSQSTTPREAGLLFSSGLGSEVKGWWWWWWWKRTSSRRPSSAGHHQDEVPVVTGSSGSGSTRRSKQAADGISCVCRAPDAHYDPRTFAGREAIRPHACSSAYPTLFFPLSVSCLAATGRLRWGKKGCCWGWLAWPGRGLCMNECGRVDGRAGGRGRRELNNGCQGTLGGKTRAASEEKATKRHVGVACLTAAH
jgi:hypothetical protein